MAERRRRRRKRPRKRRRRRKRRKEEEKAKEAEDAVTPTTGQILEISARERAVQTELEILDDRYRTVVASRRRELLEATLAERDAVAQELARREALERAETAFRAFHSPISGGVGGVGVGRSRRRSVLPASSYPIVVPGRERRAVPVETLARA